MNAAAESAVVMDAAVVAATRGTEALGAAAVIGMIPLVVIREEVVRGAVVMEAAVRVAVATAAVRVAAIRAAEEDLATRGVRVEAVVVPAVQRLKHATREGDTSAVSGKVSAGIGIMIAKMTSSAQINCADEERSEQFRESHERDDERSEMRESGRMHERSPVEEFDALIGDTIDEPAEEGEGGETGDDASSPRRKRRRRRHRGREDSVLGIERMATDDMLDLDVEPMDDAETLSDLTVAREMALEGSGVEAKSDATAQKQNGKPRRRRRPQTRSSAAVAGDGAGGGGGEAMRGAREALNPAASKARWTREVKLMTNTTNQASRKRIRRMGTHGIRACIKM